MTSTLHILMIALTLGLVAAINVVGARAQKVNRVRHVQRSLGIAMLALCLVYNAYYLWPSVFRWDTSLPLHACDVLGLVAAWVMLYPQRIARAILFCSAIPLASQAVLTPTGDQDPSTVRFWLYWIFHAGIIGLSVFDALIARYRPKFKDLAMVVAVDMAYLGIVISLNLVFGWNYGYVGNATPAGETVVDFLGPWPQRVLVIFAIVLTLQTLMLLGGKCGLAFGKAHPQHHDETRTYG